MDVRVLRFPVLVTSSLLLGVVAAIAQTVDDIPKMRQRAQELFDARNYAEALIAQRSIVAGLKNQDDSRDDELSKHMAEALGDLSRYALFARAPAEALEASDRARNVQLLDAARHSHWSETSGAHALLLLGRTEEAREIYLGNKGQDALEPKVDYPWRLRWEELVADDFDELRRAGVVHEAFPRILAELGILRPELNDAIEAAVKSVDQLGQILGPNHPDVAVALDNLAKLYREQGRFTKAGTLLVRSLAIREEVFGPNHLALGAVLDNLAALHHTEGHYYEAEQLYKRALAIREQALGPNHLDVATSLNNLAELYRQSRNLRNYGNLGEHAEVEVLYKRSLAIREKTLGRNHPGIGALLRSLSELYADSHRYAEAEAVYLRSDAIQEKMLGRKHPDVAASLDNLARRYLAQGNTVEAERLFRRSLALREQAVGHDHPDVAKSVDNLAEVYRTRSAAPRYGDRRDLGHTAEVESLYKRSLAIREKALGPDHPDVSTSFSNLAEVYWYLGRTSEAAPLLMRSVVIREKARGHGQADESATFYALAERYQGLGGYVEAEPLYKASLAMREKNLGPDHPDVAASLNKLAELYVLLGRDGDAEPLYRRSLAIREKALGPEHPDVAQSLNGLGLLSTQGEAVAELLLKRSLAIREKTLGSDHPDVAQSLQGLADVYRVQGRDFLARPLLKRSLAIREKALGPEHPDVAQSLNSLGLLRQVPTYGQPGDPPPTALLARSLAIREKALGPEHPDVAQSLNNLAVQYDGLGNFEEAERLYKRSLAIYKKTMRADHPEVGTVLNNLAWLTLHLGLRRATAYLQQGTDVIKRRAASGLDGISEASNSEQAKRFSATDFLSLLQLSDGRAPEEMFETAQWLLASDAAASLAQMAARAATGSSELAAVVRQRQDLISELQAKDKLLTTANRNRPASRSPDSEKALSDGLGTIATRLDAVNQQLSKDFPNYAALARPLPLSVDEVQAQLRADEALVLFLVTSDSNLHRLQLREETFVWVVTKSEVRLVRTDLGEKALREKVGALRCGLDNTQWENDFTSDWCPYLLRGHRRYDAGPYANVLPFHLGVAHTLYQDLFGQFEYLIRGKHLLIVPSGSLTQLPFQVLVTAPPKMDVPHDIAGYREAAWLGVRQPITVLPAVSSLKALRTRAKASQAAKAYLGVGNPLLDGRPGDIPGHAELAKLARAYARCPVGSAVATLDRRHGGVAPIEMRGGLADVAYIKLQSPLPETAEELCAVAADLKADVGEVRLGDRATETELKRLSATGELARYRVLHLATHGAMAGQLDKDREPGLILTPPETASEEDDGYLSASEIAGLKLDADWVILSACNTAAGTTSAEALSGIARAFIYAGARALLVSHWAVDSKATVKLITTAAAEMARDPNVGRAEAMRRAMLFLIENGSPIHAHPSYWAPFVVVGEGAAASAP